MSGAGDLRDLITVRRQANVKNPDTGGLQRSWTTVATMFAQVKAINSREAVIANTLQGVSTFEIVVHYRDDLKTSDQILWSGRELNIHAAEDKTGRRQWTTIIAGTEAPQGA